MVCQILIAEQQSLAMEKISRNGVVKKLHSVVKNTPFSFVLTLSEGTHEGKPVDFHNLVLEAKLLYDCEGSKEVQYVRSAPLEYLVNIDKTSPLRVTVEVQIKVLSSQHEDMFFKISFAAKDLKTGVHTDLHCTSHPIRVVSKLNQLTKTKNKQTHKRACPTSDDQSVETKRLLDETVIMLLQRLVEQQQEQHKLLLQLVQKTSNLETSLYGKSSTGASECCLKDNQTGLLNEPDQEPPLKHRKIQSSNQEILSEPAPSCWGSGEEAALLTENIGNIEDFLQDQLMTSGEYL